MTIKKFLEIADEMLDEDADNLLQEEMNHVGRDYTEDWKELNHRRKYLNELIMLYQSMEENH